MAKLRSELINESWDTLEKIQKTSFPGYRVVQFLLEFMGWIAETKHKDLFFVDEEELIAWAKEFANSQSMYFREWK